MRPKGDASTLQESPPVSMQGQTPWVLPLDSLAARDSQRVGAKAATLATLSQTTDIRVAPGYAIPCTTFAAVFGPVRVQIEGILSQHGQGRWEVLWDLYLQIRSLVQQLPIPPEVERAVMGAAAKLKAPLVVRSSAVWEDREEASCAGLHDSYLEVSMDDLMPRVRSVWASLWSARALTFKDELHISAYSDMAVLVQELVPGRSSGVVFSQAPFDHSMLVVEGVSGLNAAFISGRQSPSHWTVSREAGLPIVQYIPPMEVSDVGQRARETLAVEKPQDSSSAHTETSETGVVTNTEERGVGTEAGEVSGSGSVSDSLSVDGVVEESDSGQGSPLRETPYSPSGPVLSDAEVRAVAAVALRLEGILGSPQDVEWSLLEGADGNSDCSLCILQSRPIVSRKDPRRQYLALRLDTTELRLLYTRVLQYMEDMQNQAETMSRVDLSSLSDEALASVVTQRTSTLASWLEVYYEECIPMADGMRRSDHRFAELFVEHVPTDNPFDFAVLLEVPPSAANAAKHAVLEKRFLESTGEPGRELLFLGRESRRLRDLDNIRLAGIEAEYDRAIAEAHRRGTCKCLADVLSVPRPHLRAFESVVRPQVPSASTLSLLDSLAGSLSVPVSRACSVSPTLYRETIHHSVSLTSIGNRVLGQPASQGRAVGMARVCTGDARELVRGEVLVCKGVEPDMANAMRRACAVVEERGGMLIHGAIIARELGIPCVTGALGACQMAESQPWLEVDGYKGRVSCFSSL
ncbi:hypothetical protein KIPB_003138 [Kipferlia bialata]|uniref:pyruvate, water dikinase n=1 Tax=Kipferlia bialata TaxID=797122 RepID=A0A9K3GGG9_9EUKA|nr:hypothetical protein KIPB_003138 [Kipferlia bialata]|eukprot:g3138.t1